MQIFAISGLVNGIIATAFGILVIGKNWRERPNQIYFLMTVALALWSFSYWQWLSTVDYARALFLVRLLSIGSLFIPIFFFHWVTLLLGIKDKINRLVLWISYGASIVILSMANSPLFVSGLQQKMFFILWPNSGPVYDIYFSFLYVALITYTLYLLIRYYFIVKDSKKKGQILFILIGALVGFGGGLTNFPLWFNVMMPPYGNFLVGAFPFFLGYSVLKFGLFNAKTIVTEVFVFIISMVLLIQAILPAALWESILRWGIFVLVSFLGYLIIKSVYREVEQRERIQKLATDLEKANDRLTELDREKSEFVSFATHQLRSPLTAMKGYASMILDGDMGEMSKEARQGVSRIFDSSNTLMNIVNDYLNITRIELGSMKYAFETIDLKALIEDTIAELKPNIEKSGLAFSFKAEDRGIDWRVTADKDKLKQVIANLIDNDIKYTPSGSVDISLCFDRANHKFVMTLKDTGIGIAKEVLPHLFQKWSRAGNANKTNIKGTGLGLFVAKEMVNAHNGTIRAESEGEGKGSTFIVELEPLGKV